MRSRELLLLAGAVLVTIPTISAQEYVAQVAKVMPKRYSEATCDLKAGHFLVSSGATYLAIGSGGNRNVDGTTDPEKVRTALDKGIEVIEKAIKENDQADNGAAWYYLGRLHLQGGNIVGADSTFARATKLLPECAADIASWRNRAWLPLINLASELAGKRQEDSALALFRRAATISNVRPEGPYNMGVLFANKDQSDSAIFYFRETQRIANTDLSQFTKDRNAATFNLAALLQRTNDHAGAVAELKKYVQWVPNDIEAKRALATSLRATGDNSAADKLDKEVLASAEASGTLSANDRLSMGVTAFQEKRYEDAAEAFNEVLKSEPNSRDAIYNLVNTYLAMQNGEKLVEFAPKLIAIEPLNEDSHKFLAQGYRMLDQQDKMMEGITELMAMPTSVSVTGFVPSPTGAALSGTATGRDAEREGKALGSQAESLVVEFLAEDGSVVATADLEIPALEAAATYDWSVSVEGAGIRFWRYKVKTPAATADTTG